MNKKLLLITHVFFISLIALEDTHAQKKMNKDLALRLQLIEDKMAIKNIVDTFSLLADVKNIDEQVLLFIEDATVESVINGQSSVLRGRKEIGDGFRNFLNRFETVYHLNGQQLVNLQGMHATATSYCKVTLIANQSGNKVKTSFDIIYNDEFVKKNGRWFISKRKSNFIITATQAND